MKCSAKGSQNALPHRGLHLVKPGEACDRRPQEMDQLLADGVRRYEQLQLEFDRELFGNQDPDKIAVLLPEIQLLRERLASYGVHVKP